MSKQLVATDFKSMQIAQQDLTQSFFQKWKESERETEELAHAVAEAKNAGFPAKAMRSQLNKSRKRTIYFEKLHAAVMKGYQVIPSMPVEVFAIRTDKIKPKNEWSWSKNEQFQQTVRALPAGEGDYMSPFPERMATTAMKPDRDGNLAEHYKYLPVAMKLPDLPGNVSNPDLIGPIQHAMEMKIFDDIAVAPPRKGDPLIVGRILRPGLRPQSWSGWADTSFIHFLIAWYVHPDRDF